MDIDSVNQNLFFSAAQGAQRKVAESQRKEKNAATRKIFASALQKSHEEHELMAAGLPKELAGMEAEEAVIFLKDAADLAADKLKKSQLPENYTEYRSKVSQFLRYIEKNNFAVKERKRYIPGPKQQRRASMQKQIVVINQKLDDIARWLLAAHKDTLQMLAKIEEINGLLVDLMAT